MEDAFEPFCAIFFGMSSIIEILKNHKNKKDKRIFGLVVQGGAFDPHTPEAPCPSLHTIISLIHLNML